MKYLAAICVRTGTILGLSLGLLTGCLTMPELHLGSGPATVEPGQLHPAEGKSRVFFFHGPLMTCAGGSCIEQKLNFPFAIDVDGVQIGTLADRGSYLRADLEPGKHRVQWRDLRDSPEGEQGDMEISMERGAAYYVRVVKDSAAAPTSGTSNTAGVKITGRLENVGPAGQAEIAGKALIVADKAAVRQMALERTASGKEGDAQHGPAKTAIGGKLSELKDLYDRGLITKDEYDSKRKKWLDDWN
jgi:hypothetical protein